MSLSDREVVQLGKALDKILQTREDKWIEINNVLVYQILECFSKQLADCMRAQTKMLLGAITGDEGQDDAESERMAKMMMDQLKKS